MNNKVIIYDGGTRDYGILSDTSKALNSLLGDTTGRSISMQTAHGFKNTFQSDMSDDSAEDIVHAGMIASGLMMKSKNEGTKVGGFLLALGLATCYQNGK